MSFDFPVPPAYAAAAAQEPDAGRWLPSLSTTAARFAEAWSLEPDGAAMHGWTSVVWPVRTTRADDAGRRYVLKVSPPLPEFGTEALALTNWATSDGAAPGAPRMIIPVRADLDDHVLLLPRLDPHTSLETHPDIDEATSIIGAVLAGIAGTPAPAGIPLLTAELADLLRSIRCHGAVDDVDRTRALGRVDELTALVAGSTNWLLHADCHFLNVLHTDPNDPTAPPGWVGIDPLPVAGPREWEVTPMLRNRWADAAATGDPDRALRRRVDQLADRMGLDAALARSCAQVVAVAALQGLLPEQPDHMFTRPYQVMSRW